MAGGPLKVMVVDDHPVFAEALALAMDASGEMSCVATAPDADEARRLAAETRPDVVVMDVVLDGTDGIAATRALRQSHPGTRVLVLTGRPDRLARPRGSRGRCVGPAFEGRQPERRRRDDRIAERPLLHLRPASLRPLVRRPRPWSARWTDRARPSLLTSREQDILGLLVSGVDLQTGSVRLGITVNTARGYVKNLYRKLGVHNQLELLAVAREKGLLEAAG